MLHCFIFLSTPPLVCCDRRFLNTIDCECYRRLYSDAVAHVIHIGPSARAPTTEINVVSSDSSCVAHGFSWPQRRTVRGRVAVTSSRYPREQLGVWHTTVNNPMIPYKCLLSGKINFNERLKSILSLLHSVHPGLS